jgi:hypothetical protein
MRKTERGRRKRHLSIEERLHLFYLATARQQRRDRERGWLVEPPGTDRGWTRDDLYRARGSRD